MIIGDSKVEVRKRRNGDELILGTVLLYFDGHAGSGINPIHLLGAIGGLGSKAKAISGTAVDKVNAYHLNRVILFNELEILGEGGKLPDHLRESPREVY